MTNQTNDYLAKVITRECADWLVARSKAHLAYAKMQQAKAYGGFDPAELEDGELNPRPHLKMMRHHEETIIKMIHPGCIEAGQAILDILQVKMADFDRPLCVDLTIFEDQPSGMKDALALLNAAVECLPARLDADYPLGVHGPEA